VRPNELGGQTIENSYELNAVTASLVLNGQHNLAFKIILDKTPEGAIGNIHSSILNSDEVVRVLTPEDTAIVISSLDKIAKGKMLVPNKLDELMAQSMISKYKNDDFYPKANRIRKAITRLRRVF
jgi:MinD-like ATPase involved in chromosome partitioning or flagellar assembly